MTTIFDLLVDLIVPGALWSVPSRRATRVILLGVGTSFKRAFLALHSKKHEPEGRILGPLSFQLVFITSRLLTTKGTPLAVS